jgi:DnaJ-like protein
MATEDVKDAPTTSAEAAGEVDSDIPALPEPSHTNGALAESTAAEPRHRPNGVAVDPGLYGVLGLPPSASDTDIQTSYRQHASRLLANGTTADIAALRQLNAAYEVLGTPVRRAEYDQVRLLPPATVLHGPSSAVRPGAKQGTRVGRRRRPRYVVAARQAGLTEVLVVILVIAFSAVVGALLMQRISLNLSALNGLSGVLPGGSASTRRVIDATVTPAPVRAPTAAAAATGTPDADPGLADHFTGSTVTVSSASPATNSPETVFVRLQRDGQPASNVDVWTTVQYRTTQERWPATGTVRTDSTGAAPITFNVGPATPGYPVEVHVFAQIDGQQLSWSTTFTPH